MDAADLINSFLTGTYQVTRRAKVATVKGRAQPPVVTSLQVPACVQPANGRDLLRLPELRRSIETRRVYTATELKIGFQGSAFESDLISIDGMTWEVQNVEPWRASPSTDVGYWKCIVQATV